MVNWIQLVKLQASPILKKNFKNVAFYKKNFRESKQQQHQQQQVQQQNTTISQKDRIQGTESKAPNQKHRIKSTEKVYS